MTVYIVVRCYTEPEYMIESVFSSREKADAFVATQTEIFPPWEVQEWPIDEPELPAPEIRDLRRVLAAARRLLEDPASEPRLEALRALVAMAVETGASPQTSTTKGEP